MERGGQSQVQASGSGHPSAVCPGPAGLELVLKRGRCVLVSVFEGRPVRWSLSGLRLEDTPRGAGPVLLFLSHSFPFQYFKP